MASESEISTGAETQIPQPDSKPTGGSKFDTGKLRYSLIPQYPLSRLAEVYTIGAKKYAPYNWAKGFAWSRIIDALQRHLEAWKNGEQNDPVDGQNHLSSVAWCAFTLMEFEQTHPELDDRHREAAQIYRAS